MLNQAPADSQEARVLFDAWKRVHGKTYGSAMEDEVRSDIFHANARMVAAHNAKNDVSFTMELNQFADLSWYDSCLILLCDRRIMPWQHLWTNEWVDVVQIMAGRSSRSGTLEAHKSARRRPSTFSLSQLILYWFTGINFTIVYVFLTAPHSRTPACRRRRTGATMAWCRL